tara:strand:+ start:87 stop:746 length:660 start_codon:yes stop_codon:yes gene_type:complete
MKILIACETSGTVRNAFLENGHDAWSCDILPSDDGSNRHITEDVRNVLAMEKWDLLMVAHPPCTRLCNSGVRWLKKAPPGKTLAEMWNDLDEGARLFSDLWNADIPRVAVENPVMHKHGKSRIQKVSSRDFPWKATQTVQPWQFGNDPEGDNNVTKRTCLWLRGLEPLVPTGSLDGSSARADIHNASPGPDRWKVRSKFFPGLAAAMANQWAGNINEER